MAGKEKLSWFFGLWTSYYLPDTDSEYYTFIFLWILCRHPHQSCSSHEDLDSQRILYESHHVLHLLSQHLLLSPELHPLHLQLCWIWLLASRWTPWWYWTRVYAHLCHILGEPAPLHCHPVRDPQGPPPPQGQGCPVKDGEKQWEGGQCSFVSVWQN